jgi:hypothetical protein
MLIISLYATLLDEKSLVGFVLLFWMFGGFSFPNRVEINKNISQEFSKRGTVVVSVVSLYCKAKNK